MSKIEDLISRLCPGGVEFKKVDEVLRKIVSPPSVAKNDYLLVGRFPIVNQAQKLIAGFADDESKVLPCGDYIVFGDHTRVVKWIDFEFISGESGTLIFKTKEEMNPKYIYYAVKNLTVESRGYNRHWTVLKELQVPIPPLEIQNEIVKILDTFTELESELEAELEARKRQYATHVAKLFDDHGQKFEILRIADFANCYAGATPLTSKSEYWDEGNIPWIASGEVNKGTIYEANSYITELGFKNSSTKMVPAGSVLIALAGQGKTRGMVARTRLDACTNQSLCAIVPDAKVNSDYLYFYMKTQYMAYRAMSAGEGGRGGLNLQDIRSIMIPVPNLETQLQIVQILEKFESLISDISIGIPAEINARRQQYEYYRNKLLTFKELEVA